MEKEGKNSEGENIKEYKERTDESERTKKRN